MDKHACMLEQMFAMKAASFAITKDERSFSPKDSFCGEVNSTQNHKSSDKVFVMDTNLCLFKQMKNVIQLFVFQRYFLRKNLSMQFMPEHGVGQELRKLTDRKNLVTECVKSYLITYTLFYNITKEIYNPNLDFKPDVNCDGFLQFI